MTCWPTIPPLAASPISIPEVQREYDLTIEDIRAGRKFAGELVPRSFNREGMPVFVQPTRGRSVHYEPDGQSNSKTVDPRTVRPTIQSNGGVMREGNQRQTNGPAAGAPATFNDAVTGFAGWRVALGLN